MNTKESEHEPNYDPNQQQDYTANTDTATQAQHRTNTVAEVDMETQARKSGVNRKQEADYDLKQKQHEQTKLATLHVLGEQTRQEMARNNDEGSVHRVMEQAHHENTENENQS